MSISKKDWSVKRTDLKGQQNQVKQLSEADKAQQRAQAQAIIKLFTETPPGADQFGKVVAGFQSLGENVKPKGNKKDPTPSVMGATVGKNSSNTATPSQKSAIDTLTEKTTTANNIVKKALSDGSPEGIRNALADVLNLYEDEINEGLAEANKAADDPVVKEKFAEFGFDAAQIKEVTGSIDNGDLSKIIREDPSKAITKQQKNVTDKQMEALGNPFGSFKVTEANAKLGLNVGDPISPGSDIMNQLQSITGKTFNQLSEKNVFGIKGVDNANLMGSLATRSKGLSPMRELGKDVSVASLSEEQISKIAGNDPIPNIIQKNGFTNLSKTVDLGNLTAVTEPTTPVQTSGVSSGRGQEEMLFQPVHGIKEIELDLRSIKRKITNINVGWTSNFIDRRYTAKQYHEIEKENKRKNNPTTFNNLPEYDTGARCHYFIYRDGSIERVIPLERYPSASPGVLQEDFAKIYKEGISIILDAGFTTSFPGGLGNLSSKSISDKQWATLDMFFGAAVKVMPSVNGIGWDEAMEQTEFNIPGISLMLGPDFNVNHYLKKFKGDDE